MIRPFYDGTYIAYYTIKHLVIIFKFRFIDINEYEYIYIWLIILLIAGVWSIQYYRFNFSLYKFFTSFITSFKILFKFLSLIDTYMLPTPIISIIKYYIILWADTQVTSRPTKIKETWDLGSETFSKKTTELTLVWPHGFSRLLIFTAFKLLSQSTLYPNDSNTIQISNKFCYYLLLQQCRF